MRRSTALWRYALLGLVPGAVLGGGIALLVSIASQRADFLWVIIGCGGLGSVFGMAIGAIIADHRFPS